MPFPFFSYIMIHSADQFDEFSESKQWLFDISNILVCNLSRLMRNIACCTTRLYRSDLKSSESNFANNSKHREVLPRENHTLVSMCMKSRRCMVTNFQIRVGKLVLFYLQLNRGASHPVIYTILYRVAPPPPPQKKKKKKKKHGTVDTVDFQDFALINSYIFSISRVPRHD